MLRVTSRFSYGALPPLQRRRVVVTGLGAVTPLGHTAASTWEALMQPQQQTAAVPLTDIPSFLKAFDTEMGEKGVAAFLDTLPVKFACPAKNAPDQAAGKSYDATSRECRYQRFASTAAEEALEQAGLLVDPAENTGAKTARIINSQLYREERCGVHIGVGMPSLVDVSEVSFNIAKGKYNRVSPFFVPKVLANSTAGAVATRHRLRGPNESLSTACASGAHSIGDAARWIASGACDVAICGATDSCITPVAMAGFARMKALATKSTFTPAQLSRPFDEDRCGFVMGEGAGVLVLEDMESVVAQGREKHILCELRGYGLSGDGYHVSSPHPEGVGAQQCIEMALGDGGVSPDDVGYLNCHATGTPMGDEIELAAATRSLRPSNNNDSSTTSPLLVSSTKGSMGHLLGAAGSVEAIVAVMALVHGKAPVTANLDTPVKHDESKVRLCRGYAPEEITYQKNEGDSARGGAAMSTSFGFGGTNSALVFTRV